MAAEPRATDPTTRVLIVDDHILYREMITSVVDAVKGLRVIGWATNESEALRLCWRERPGLVVLDLMLPSGDGLATLERITAVCPGARILVFSGHLTPGVIRRLLALGPHSAVGKGASLDAFREALRSVAAGRTYYSPETAAAIRSLVVNHGRAGPAGGPRLTLREEAVLTCLARGLTTREAAAELGISRFTVANHLSRLRRKTGLTRIAHLSLYALQLGLLELPAEAKPRRSPNP